MKVLVPSTHRIQDQNQSPLTPEIRPLLQSTVQSICKAIEKIMPQRNSSCSEDQGSYYRPRLLIRGGPGQGLTTYVGPAILHAFETLPCHKLDITTLFSNAARSPEEALFHVVHEARRTVPSILYIPHFMTLWQNVMTGQHATLREAFVSLVSDIQPTAPLLILAITEDMGGSAYDGDEEPVASASPEHADVADAMKLFCGADQIYMVENPTKDERKNYFRPIFDAAAKPPQEECSEEKSRADAHKKEALAIVPLADTRKLSEKEEKRLKRKEDALLRELRIFLR